jgi:hypothetical protein
MNERFRPAPMVKRVLLEQSNHNHNTNHSNSILNRMNNFNAFGKFDQVYGRTCDACLLTLSNTYTQTPLKTRVRPRATRATRCTCESNNAMGANVSQQWPA